MINRLGRIPHPPLKELIKLINKVIDDNYIKYIEVVIKNNPIRKSKKHINKQGLIYQIMIDEDSYDDKSLFESLRKYSPIMKYKFEYVSEDDELEFEELEKEEQEIKVMEELEKDETLMIEENEIIEIKSSAESTDKSITIEINIDKQIKEADKDIFFMDREREINHYDNCWDCYEIEEEQIEKWKALEENVLNVNKNQNENNQMETIEENKNEFLKD